MLFGEAGVGKTRLVADAVASRQAAGAVVEWVRATEAARDIPLGSFAHVLRPGDDAHLPDDLLHLALARLQARAGASGPSSSRSTTPTCSTTPRSPSSTSPSPSRRCGS